jgi:hypothetical protein
MTLLLTQELLERCYEASHNKIIKYNQLVAKTFLRDSEFRTPTVQRNLTCYCKHPSPALKAISKLENNQPL